MTGKELWYITQAHAYGHLAGDGLYTQKCHSWLENHIGTHKALLTHSCTAALEMAAILADIKPGDEVIMPSYTFVSTANAFVLRGAVPVFVDIRPDTHNINECLIESAITEKTRVIVPVHYAGVGCDMDSIMSIADKYNLFVIEDAAQGIMSTYKGRPLGSIGHLGCLSFHETKNIISGEGGALLINDPTLAQRAEIIREKGTNRSQFFRGQIDKYTWIDIGSSYLPSEMIAAFLWAQMEEAEEITSRRLDLWNKYHKAFLDLESERKVIRPIIPMDCNHNAHMYYLIFPDLSTRTNCINFLKNSNISAVFHYVPIHSSPAGKKYCKTSSSMIHSKLVSENLLRLPLWIGMEEEIEIVIKKVKEFFINN